MTALTREEVEALVNELTAFGDDRYTRFAGKTRTQRSVDVARALLATMDQLEAVTAERDRKQRAVETAWAARERTADERDEAIRLSMKNALRAEAAETANAALTARVAELEGALTPFARESVAWPDDWPETANNIDNIALDLTKADFTKARTASASHGKETT